MLYEKIIISLKEWKEKRDKEAKRRALLDKLRRYPNTEYSKVDMGRTIKEAKRYKKTLK